ncbi:hypothetical protein G7Z17_g12734 [Cylindrodendrum hubeiense]|uniref:5'-deoxynucleotidase n=1 Tax=Cylindrodendrum hubeiense TaxID=595255 RepID=A0A9P5H2F3_9HYPO|nr:hypothetical protein G7Z17_g12734 [Cylindrodendrum hubeiense]
MENLSEQLDKSPYPLLHMLQGLKQLPREGWRRFIDQPESVASHMWGVALLGFITAPEDADPFKCMFIGIIHDLAECVVGDIPTFAGISKVDQLKAYHPARAELLRAAYIEYDEGTTLEGRHMKETDKLECLFQAAEYEAQTYGEKPGLEEFQSVKRHIRSQQNTALSDLLTRKREVDSAKRKRRLPLIFITGDYELGSAYCDAFVQKNGYQHTSLHKLLKEKSEDETYIHSALLKQLFAAGFHPPKDLTVKLLEDKLEEDRNRGVKCSLVSGFPESMEQLHEFETTVRENSLYPSKY